MNFISKCMIVFGFFMSNGFFATSDEVRANTSFYSQDIARAIASAGTVVGGIGFWKYAPKAFAWNNKNIRNPFLTVFVFSAAVNNSINFCENNAVRSFACSMKKSDWMKSNRIEYRYPNIAL